jgi:hypothetical protein
VDGFREAPLRQAEPLADDRWRGTKLSKQNQPPRGDFLPIGWSFWIGAGDLNLELR